MCTNPNILCIWFQPLQQQPPPPPPHPTLKTCTNFSSGIGEHVTKCVFSLPLFFTWQFENLAAWPTREPDSWEPHSCCVLQNQTSGGHGGGGHTYRETHTQTFGRACAKKELLHMPYIPLKEGAPPRSRRTLYGTQHLKGANYSRD